MNNLLGMNYAVGTGCWRHGANIIPVERQPWKLGLKGLFGKIMQYSDLFDIYWTKLYTVHNSFVPGNDLSYFCHSVNECHNKGKS
jgi:hypothetical protein